MRAGVRYTPHTMKNKIFASLASVVFAVSTVSTVGANAQTVENPPLNQPVRVYLPVVSRTADIEALKKRLVSDYSRICGDQTLAEYDTVTQFVFTSFDGVWIDQEILVGYSAITGRPRIVLENDSPQYMNDALIDGCVSQWVRENGGRILPDEAGNLTVLWSVVD